jgi:NADPH:quinone reductase-like Zn-dependent oxidoreductase
MRAIVVTDRRTGRLEQVERPAPTPGKGELLVRVVAAGVNPVDWKMRSGVLGRLAARAMPEIPGIDVAGVVEVAGPAANGPAGESVGVGTPVIGFTRRGGAFADLALVEQALATRKPEGLGFPEAAAIPIAGLTALQALRDRAKLSPGQKLLVNGASGGVGTFAIQLGRLFGARVTAVTSARNEAMVRELGAERVIDYQREDFTRGSEEYDVIFDAIGNRSFRDCAPRLTREGIYLTTLPGPANLLPLVKTRLGAKGKKRAILANVQPKSSDLAYLADLAAKGTVKPIVERILPLSEYEAAMAASRGGHVHGKLVLAVGAASGA